MLLRLRRLSNFIPALPRRGGGGFLVGGAEGWEFKSALGRNLFWGVGIFWGCVLKKMI